MKTVSNYRITLRDELEAEMKVIGLVQKGVSFPKQLFQSGSTRERTALFDAAYDLACERMGVLYAEVLDEEDRVRFLPCLGGIG